MRTLQNDSVWSDLKNSYVCICICFKPTEHFFLLFCVLYLDDYQTAQLLSLVLELLTFCVEHHTYHVKNYIINKDILKRVLVLLKSSHQFLVLGESSSPCGIVFNGLVDSSSWCDASLVLVSLWVV